MSNLLLENNNLRNVTRTIIKDLVNIYKNESYGEFYLPMDAHNDIDFYNFPGFEYDIVLEFDLVEDSTIDDFIIDGELDRKNNLIQIVLHYNPENKFNILYDLVGQLNETLSHELRHIYQKETGLYNLNVREKRNPLSYYTQPHEIDAQVFGFNRLSKLAKKPFDLVVNDWFKRNKKIHRLSDEQVKEVIKKIINHKNKL